MILVDPSAWIDYVRGTPTVRTDKLYKLPGNEPVVIGDLILTEVLQGFGNDRDFNEAKRLLTSLPVLDLGGRAVAVQVAKNHHALRALNQSPARWSRHPGTPAPRSPPSFASSVRSRRRGLDASFPNSLANPRSSPLRGTSPQPSRRRS